MTTTDTSERGPKRLICTAQVQVLKQAGLKENYKEGEDGTD